MQELINLRKQGKSYKQIANILNEQELTNNGKEWTHKTVNRWITNNAPELKKVEKLVQEHGINDTPINKTKEKFKYQAYRSWSRILERVYSEAYHKRNPTYKDCTVCKEWLTLSNYIKWYEKNYIEGYHLDKDILVHNNKHYSPNTCVFVPKDINTLLVDNLGKRGEFKQGIVGITTSGKYRVECAVFGK